MSKRKFYRTVIQVEILSEEKFDTDGSMNLNDIELAITDGDCSGRVKTLIHNEVKNSQEIVELLKEQGSDCAFFQLAEVPDFSYALSVNLFLFFRIFFVILDIQNRRKFAHYICLKFDFRVYFRIF